MTFIIGGKQATINAYNIGGNNYLQVRDMLELFDKCGLYNAAESTVVLDTTRPFSESEI